MSQFPFATPLADWHGPGAWILLVPVVWFACALVFVLILRQLGWGWGRGCGPGRHARRRWEEDDGPGAPAPPGATEPLPGPKHAQSQAAPNPLGGTQEKRGTLSEPPRSS